MVVIMGTKFEIVRGLTMKLLFRTLSKFTVYSLLNCNSRDAGASDKLLYSFFRVVLCNINALDISESINFRIA